MEWNLFTMPNSFRICFIYVLVAELVATCRGQNAVMLCDIYTIGKRTKELSWGMDLLT